MPLLREGILDGTTVVLDAAPEAPYAARLAELGARLTRLADPPGREWTPRTRPLHALVFDARPAFGTGGRERLALTLQRAWAAVRVVGAGELVQSGGRVILIAPPPDAGPLAAAAVAALENLVRTLSVEWARFAVNPVAVAPGRRTTEEELAELLAFLLSPAGGYFSGCRIGVR